MWLALEAFHKKASPGAGVERLGRTVAEGESRYFRVESEGVFVDLRLVKLFRNLSSEAAPRHDLLLAKLCCSGSYIKEIDYFCGLRIKHESTRFRGHGVPLFLCKPYEMFR